MQLSDEIEAEQSIINSQKMVVDHAIEQLEAMFLLTFILTFGYFLANFERLVHSPNFASKYSSESS